VAKPCSLPDKARIFLDGCAVNFGGFSTTITGDAASTYQTETYSIPGTDISAAGTKLSFQGSSQNWNLGDVSASRPRSRHPNRRRPRSWRARHCWSSRFAFVDDRLTPDRAPPVSQVLNPPLARKPDLRTAVAGVFGY